MSAASTHRPPHPRSRRALGAALCCAAAFASAGQPAATLKDRIAELRESIRFVPERSMPSLLAMDAEASKAPLREHSEYLGLVANGYLQLGKMDKADAACDQLIALGRANNSNTTLAKGLLIKGYIEYSRGQLAESHRTVWQAEKLATDTDDPELKLRVLVSSGESFAEEGNFPRALDKLQSAASLARQGGVPYQIAIALTSLARLYDEMREYEKGFATLDEASPWADKTGSPGRIATLKMVEYGLAIDSKQPKRAREALLAALAAQRKMGANAEVARTLGNLADSYLKLGDYQNTIAYANQAYEAGRKLNAVWTMSVARVNIGEALIGQGRLAEGKRAVEEGLQMIEQTKDKPSLQAALSEYGEALEKAGDYISAIKAYHRERDLSNELFEKRRQKLAMELQAKYEADKREQQIELLRRENQVKSAELDNRRLQQRVWWLLALVFALSSVIVGILYRKVRNANARLEEKNLELKQQSVRDPLTGLYNRRHFQEYMRNYQPTEKRGAGTSGEDVVGALFLLDVDQFKHINDSCGHAAGDSVLKAIAASMREILRDTDMIVRWGGEEFLAFLPAIPRSGLDEIARRLLSGISSIVIDHQGKSLSANVSIGFAPYPIGAPGQEPMSWERSVNLVDMALYLAKGHGRNRAYGVRSVASLDETTVQMVEQDLERAWREGHVDLSIVLGGAWPELRAAV
jgi:diguanylate cyclase (GGDEF)-like protein